MEADVRYIKDGSLPLTVVNEVLLNSSQCDLVVDMVVEVLLNSNSRCDLVVL